MAALDDLKAATAKVQTSIDAAVTLIGQLRIAPAGTSDADVEAVVTELNTASAALDAAVNPPSSVPAG